MMYSEFITLSGKSESYISYVEYTVYIEPIYTDCELSKVEFIDIFNDIFEKLVYPAVERCIHLLSAKDKYVLAGLVDGHEEEAVTIKDQIKSVELDARMVAYQYINFYVNL